MKTILITGATGFLGSHIAEGLVRQKYKVVATKRKLSSMNRANDFREKVTWIDSDDEIILEKEILKYNPDILIHAAWGGVKADDRNNWSEQGKNLSFLLSLFNIIKKTKISKIISLGSQAEYGKFEGIIDEEYPCNPNSAYGAIKVSSSILLKSFAEQNNIEWYWIRLFSVFGPGEDLDWLIPSAINNLITKRVMSLTLCEQKYDYLYIKDFVRGILAVIQSNNNYSDVYNFSSGKSIELKEILTYLENKLSPRKKLLAFGEFPYRANQVMHMQGNSDKFFQTFNFKPNYSIFEGLEETVKYYKNLDQNE